MENRRRKALFRLFGRVAAVAVASIVLASPAASQDASKSSRPDTVVVPTSQTPAQQAAMAATGRELTNQDIADAIRRSGMSEAQVRDRLQAAGYDPSLADPFFSPDAGASSPSPNAAFVSALQQVGILQQGTQSAAETNGEDTAQTRVPVGRDGGSEVFGADVFGARSSAFEPVLSGPVDPSYRLGVGDQLQIVLTGDVEAAYNVDVRRDGSIILPQIGQIQLAGLTLDAGRGLVGQRAARVYSSLESGRTKLDLTLGRIRNVAVFVVGEVNHPGAYQVSAISSVFHALTKAGGPTDRGSFRDIQLRRGGKLFRTFDLYDYLLNGDESQDVRVEQGDVIFVPFNTRAVVLRGAVRRPGVYELRPGEGLSELLRFAGGMLPTASSDRLQIDRILPPAARTPGHDRVLVDVPFHGNAATLDTVSLAENDVVHVFEIGELRRDMIRVHGAVFQPGRFEWKPGLTLGGAIAMAEGPLPWGMADRVKVVRTIRQTGQKKIFSLSLSDSSQARFPIQEFDEITVLDGRLENPSDSILVTGAVNTPGKRDFAENLTLRDAIDLAGGFSDRAGQVEVARRVLREGYTDTTSVVFRFPLTPDRQLSPQAASFALMRGDEVSVRNSPGARHFGTVHVSGLFAYPGTYAIRTDRERLADIIRRAGGTLPTASPATFRVVRDGRVVAVSMVDVLNGTGENLQVQDGDEISIAADPAVVFVTGAVARKVAVPFRRGWSVEDYLNSAGGLTPDADRNQLVVEYADGGVAHTRVHARFFRQDPEVLPGATISVAAKPVTSQDHWRESLTTVLQLSSMLASLAVAWAAIKK